MRGRMAIFLYVAANTANAGSAGAADLDGPAEPDAKALSGICRRKRIIMQKGTKNPGINTRDGVHDSEYCE